MSITISEILRLPSLQGARVVGGSQGLERRISTISVSEYTRGSQFKDLHFDSFESEIVISAFYASRDSVEKQCETLEGFHANNVAGLILFYVGVILPYVDDRLIALANALSFPLIVMPEDRPDLRYGEVIYEVMEAVVKSRLVGYDFKNDVIEQVSRFPKYQQSVSAVMRILSDRIHATIILADSSGEPLNASVWPRNLAVESYLQDGKVPFNGDTAQLHGEAYTVYGCPIKASGGISLRAVVYKRGEPLALDVVRQIGETIQVSMNLWDRDHGENMLPALVGAILRDEPYKIRRLSALYGIRVQSLKDMWIVSPAGEDKAEALLKYVPRLISEELSHMGEPVIFDIHDGSIVVFLGAQRSGAVQFNEAQSLGACLKKRGLDAVVTICRGLEAPAHARKAYLVNKGALPIAREIYPAKMLFQFSEIKFADKCKKIIESGESAVAQYTEILSAIPNDGISCHDMLKTLSAYYLDAECDVARTGEILYLHKNTIQYRIKKFREAAPDGLESIPEIDELYTALALNRILESARAK